MFKKLVFTSSLALLAVATPTPQASQCNTGPIQCCNSLQHADSPSVAPLLGLLGIVVQSVTALVGVGCSPISVGFSFFLLRLPLRY
jgi:hypothetical protein